MAYYGFYKSTRYNFLRVVNIARGDTNRASNSKQKLNERDFQFLIAFNQN